MIYSEYVERVRARVAASLCVAPKPLFEIVRDCRGAYPSLVRDALATSGSSVHEHVCKCYSRDYRPSSEGVDCLIPKLEGNPILCSWYFTDSCCERIQHLLDWSEKSLAFVGTPRLFEWFRAHCPARRLVLFEIDDLVLRTLDKVSARENCSLIRYDLDDDLPVEYRGAFDCVFTDPPWYVDHYRLWISRAMSLLRGGQLFVSLFPELLRPGAVEDRSTILDVIRSFTDSMSLLYTFLDYDVPSFEQYELMSNGFSDIRPWKTADLLIANLTTPVSMPEFRITPEWRDWREVDVGRVRIFVNETRAANTTSLLSPPAGGRTILESPSRRNPVFAEVNVLTSRGHGLLSADTSMLVEVLCRLNESLQLGISKGTAVAKLQLSPSVESLLLEVLG